MFFFSKSFFKRIKNRRFEIKNTEIRRRFCSFFYGKSKISTFYEREKINTLNIPLAVSSKMLFLSAYILNVHTSKNKKYSEIKCLLTFLVVCSCNIPPSCS